MIKLLELFDLRKVVLLMITSLMLMFLDTVFTLLVADLLSFIQGVEDFYILKSFQDFGDSWLVIGAIITISIRFPIYIFVSYLLNKITYDIFTSAGYKALEKHYFSPIESSKINSAGFCSKAFSNDMNALIGGVLTPFIIVVIEVGTIVTVGLLLFLQVGAGFSPLFLFVIFISTTIFASYFFSRKLTTEGLRRNVLEKEKSAWLISLERTYKDLVGIDGFNFYADRFNLLNRLIAVSATKIGVALSASKVSVESIFGLMVILVSAYAISDGNSSQLSDQQTISLAVAFFLRLMPSVNRISQSFVSIFGQIGVLQEVVTLGYRKNFIERECDVVETSEFINFENLLVKGNKKILLESRSVSFRKNAFNVVYGESGAGKTLLLGTINEKLDKSGERVAYLRQEIGFLDTGAKENITFKNDLKKEDVNKLREICLSLKIPEWVIDIDDGDRFSKLSGGQRQRVGLARCLFHERKILILDEFTSALDESTERSVVETLMSIKGLTIICSAHRKYLLDLECNKIQVKNGSASNV